MALRGCAKAPDQCPLSGVKQTSQFIGVMSAFDPKQTFDVAIKEKAPDDAGALNFIRSRSDQYFATTGPLPQLPKR
jgi:hypothetical protein